MDSLQENFALITMKLHKESIMYPIKLYKQWIERINNPTLYMLAILYNTPEQIFKTGLINCKRNFLYLTNLIILST